MNSAFIVRGEGECLVIRRSSGAFTIMAGQRGSKGRDGSGASSTFIYEKPLAATVWTVPHNLDRRPSVTVVGTDDQVVTADVGYVDDNIIQITFASPFAGKAYCN